MLMGCSAEEQLSKTDQHQAAAYPEIDASIEWFGGTMEEAFALAESTDKPLFLYWGAVWRSEEHTSELQSRRNLVCRLLLEKKKNN